MAHDAASVLATALVVLLVVVQPIRGRGRYQRLVAELATDPSARVRFYARGIISAWIAVGIVAVIGALDGRGPSSIGLTLARLKPNAIALTLLYVSLSGIALGVSLIVIWRGGENLLERFRQQVHGFAAMLPRSRRERRAFALVAVTAGICEEILYRGFGIAFVRWLFPRASSLTIIVVIGVAFGLAHLYQGVRGVVLTGLIGALLAFVTIATGTLLPAILIHVLVDLRVVFLPEALSEPAPAPT